MITYCKLINAVCESSSNDYRCWLETEIVLNKHQQKRSAFKRLKAMGWKLEGKILCPFCNKGILISQTNH